MKTSVRLILILHLLFVFSCDTNESSNESESELINRVNDVMEQIAVQGNISEEEKQAIISLANLIQDENDASSYVNVKEAISYADVEVKPVYVGCENEISKDCFKNRLASLIEAEFDKTLFNKTKIEKETTVEYFLLIDKTGKVTNRKIRESNVVVLAELARVLKLIPIMKPAYQNGKAVEVMYNGTFTYGG
ncbi:hypothetical protein [Winogradskyella sp. PE311]|uniref:hypothetical protein n=1 Tax=Winogradskyella sp. PE311 TaxID=3366943 RepID=UPI003980E2AA